MRNWWKALAIILLVYSLIGGLLIDVPRQVILYESIRNLYFHVPMWFSMITLFFISMIYSIKNLSSSNLEDDRKAIQMVNVGIIFGILGTITGSIWAKFTWGAFWTNDVKLNGSAITMLIYLAYVILRGSMDDEQKRARISAVYNIFAFVLLLVFIGILPRMTDSLHPGNGGNPGFNNYDLDNNMKLVFYPAVLGWILLGLWLSNIRIRMANLKEKLINR
ncbi:MAG: cytochrome c biogenesis protein [Vicingaceae bacterium]